MVLTVPTASGSAIHSAAGMAIWAACQDQSPYSRGSYAEVSTFTRPPSMSRTAPWTKAASSEAR
jgi:hypothetical protein